MHALSKNRKLGDRMHARQAQCHHVCSVLWLHARMRELVHLICCRSCSLHAEREREHAAAFDQQVNAQRLAASCRLHALLLAAALRIK